MTDQYLVSENWERYTSQLDILLISRRILLKTADMEIAQCTLSKYTFLLSVACELEAISTFNVQ